jgi:CRISPR/Cas system-associated endonuclease Cas1
MWLFSGASDDPETDAVMENQGAAALYSALNSLMHTIQTKNKDPQQDAVNQIIQSAKPSTIRRWSAGELANGLPLV